MHKQFSIEGYIFITKGHLPKHCITVVKRKIIPNHKIKNVKGS